MKKIEVSNELFESIQQLKEIFGEITGEKIDSDEEVLGILISGFVESMNIDKEGGDDCNCGGNCGDDCSCKN